MFNTSWFIILIFSLIRVTREEIAGFIVKGNHVSSIRDMPYCVFLYIDDDMTCGASVLTQEILITAAHCLENVKCVTATAGNLNKNEGIKRKVERYYYHEKFREVTMENDIGLCKLRKPFELGESIKRVVLLNKPPPYKYGVVAGWGEVEDYVHSDTLEYAKQKVWTHKMCKEILIMLPKGVICAGERFSSTFASKGDSGAALVVHGFIQIGLASFKDALIAHGLVVYTDLTYFDDWIKESVKYISC